jgi:hypothetical protein
MAQDVAPFPAVPVFVGRHPKRKFQPGVITMANTPSETTIIPPPAWDAFLSQLAVAENAAATQFAYIAERLHAEGHHEHAGKYEALAGEERGHHERACRTYRDYVPPTTKILELYRGGLASAPIFLVERMAVAHCVHETAALGMLGHLYGHVHLHMQDARWAKNLRQMCASLLRDEVHHVRDGKVLVAHYLARESPAVRIQVQTSVRLHRAMVVRSVRRLFPGDGPRPFVEAMLNNFDRRYRDATADILGGP